MPPMSRQRVVASSRRWRFSMSYVPVRNFSRIRISSHAPATVKTGTCSLSWPDRRSGNSDSMEIFTVWRIVVGEFSESRCWRCGLGIRGEYIVR